MSTEHPTAEKRPKRESFAKDYRGDVQFHLALNKWQYGIIESQAAKIAELEQALERTEAHWRQELEAYSSPVETKVAQCQPPCPLELCAQWSAVGMCLHPANTKPADCYCKVSSSGKVVEICEHCAAKNTKPADKGAATPIAITLVHRICHAASGQCMAFDHPECSPCTPENCNSMKAAQNTSGSQS